MEENDFRMLLHHLGRDIRYIALELQKDIEKHSKILSKTGDTKKFCQKLSDILCRLSGNTRSLATTLTQRIDGYGQKDDEFNAILTKVQSITTPITEVSCNTCKSKNNEATTLSNLESPPEISVNNNSEVALSQHSVQIDDDQLKAEQESILTESVINGSFGSQLSSNSAINNNDSGVSKSQENYEIEEFQEGDQIPDNLEISQEVEVEDNCGEIEENSDSNPSQLEETEKNEETVQKDTITIRSEENEEHQIQEGEDPNFDARTEYFPSNDSENEIPSSDETVCHDSEDLANLQEEELANSQEEELANSQEKELVNSQEEELANSQEEELANSQEEELANTQEDLPNSVDYECPTQLITNNSPDLFEEGGTSKNLNKSTEGPESDSSGKNDGKDVSSNDSSQFTQQSMVFELSPEPEAAATEDDNMQVDESQQNSQINPLSEESLVFTLENDAPEAIGTTSQNEPDAAETSAADENNENEKSPEGATNTQNTDSWPTTESGNGPAGSLGDISESDTQTEDVSQTKQIRQKLKEKERKALLKVIAEFYSKRKKARTLNKAGETCSSDENEKEQKTKKKYKKSPSKRTPRKIEEEDESDDSLVRVSKRRGLKKVKRNLNFISAAHIDESSSSSFEEASRQTEDKEVNESDSSEKANVESNDSQATIIIPRNDISAFEQSSVLPNDSEQVVSPYKKKGVKRLHSSGESEADCPKRPTKEGENQEVASDASKSDSEVTKTAPEMGLTQESAVVGPFRKNAGSKRLLSTEEEKEDAPMPFEPSQSDSDAEQVVSPYKKKAPQRLHSSGDSENELRSSQIVGENTSQSDSEVTKTASEVSFTQESGVVERFRKNAGSKKLLSSEDEREDATQSDSELLKATDKELIQDKLQSTDNDSEIAQACSEASISDSELPKTASDIAFSQETEVAGPRGCKRGSNTDDDSDVNDTKKRRTETVGEKTNGNEEEKSQFALGENDRDDLLDMLDEHLSSRNKEETKNEGEKVKKDEDESAFLDFHLNENERDELLDMLNERMERSVDLEPEKINKNTLMELLKEYQDVVKKGDDELSHSASRLLKVVREETIENDVENKAWEVFQALLKDDDDISDTSSDSVSIDIDGSDFDFSDQERRQKQAQYYSQLRQQFGVSKELIVNVERSDISGYDLTGFPRKTRDFMKVDRLCDLSNVLTKRKQLKKKNTLRKKPRKRSSSSSEDSDSSYSSSDYEDCANDSAAPSPSPLKVVDEEEQERLALALWDNIKNSSDDDLSSLSSEEDSSDDEIEVIRKKGKPKKDKEGDGTKGTEDDDTSSKESDEEGDKSNKKKTDISKEADLDSSDQEDFVGISKDRGAWRNDPLLRSCLTSDEDSDFSDSENRRKKRTEKITKKLDKLLDDDDSDGGECANGKSRKKLPEPLELSDDSDVEFVVEKQQTPQKTGIDENADGADDSPSKKGKGRRNIRALMDDDDLAEATQKANEEEKERLRRLKERNKAKETYSQSFGSFGSQLSEDDVEPLILDVHEDNQIKVHPKITRKLKPHQRSGIQFMWDSCYESVEQLKKGWEGSGCILAHCMGLGKTLQALALIHTLFNNKITKTKHVLVVCPLSTVSNWRNEYNLAYKGIRNCNVQIHTIQDAKDASKRAQIVNRWWRNGGMLVMGYECFGMLTNDRKLEKWESQGACRREDLVRALVDPGPDLVICDEGHLLRNKQTQRTLALNKVKTKRRIVLTGTPLQNNLLEYYYMVHFVKPNLLGTEKEYKTNFVNPISNGQFEDSTAGDIFLMKKRTHVLHTLLNPTVQRVEDTELKQYLPQLVDQALFIKLSDLQVKFYNHYLDTANARPVFYTAAGNISRKNFLADVQIVRYICSHPHIIAIAQKRDKSKIKEQDVVEDDALEVDLDSKVSFRGDWYKTLIPDGGFESLEFGSKMTVAMGIVEGAIAQQDKVLIFSQAHAEMDILELFLNQQFKFKKGVDYYRMDGTISPDQRTVMCDRFNDPKNKKLKVFIMSTKVGGLGLNLTAANRVIIMNVHWNPSYDTQSVYRAFRFGQNKAVYVYRLIAIDTMEEKMYQRTVTKLAIAHRVVDKYQITRHYTAMDIQEFYSSRPSVGGERPIPNVPEDKILATLIQKYNFLYKWHEHQALLANRPEEDLDEQQKNAAWEEFNKKNEEPTLPELPLAPQLSSQFTSAANILRQMVPGPSGLQNWVNLPQGNQALMGPREMQNRVNLFQGNQALMGPRGMQNRVNLSQEQQALMAQRGLQNRLNLPQDHQSPMGQRGLQNRLSLRQETQNPMGQRGLQNRLSLPQGNSAPASQRPTPGSVSDHNYSLPKHNYVTIRTDSMEDFQNVPIPPFALRSRFMIFKIPTQRLPDRPSNYRTYISKKSRPAMGHRTTSLDDFRPTPIQLPPKTQTTKQVVINPAAAHRPRPPGIVSTQQQQSSSVNTPIRIPSSLTVSVNQNSTNSSPKVMPPQKPSISIIPQRAPTGPNNVALKPPHYIPKPPNTIVLSPRQKKHMAPSPSIANGQKKHPVPSPSTANEKKKNIVPSSSIASGQKKYTVSSPTIVSRQNKTIANSPSIVTSRPTPIIPTRKIVMPNKVVIPSSLTVTSTSSSPATQSQSEQSPLQKHMRNFMEHLHQLQSQMKEKSQVKPGNAVKNLSNIVSQASTSVTSSTTSRPIARMIGSLPNRLGGASAIGSAHVPVSPTNGNVRKVVVGPHTLPRDIRMTSVGANGAKMSPKSPVAKKIIVYPVNKPNDAINGVSPLKVAMVQKIRKLLPEPPKTSFLHKGKTYPSHKQVTTQRSQEVTFQSLLNPQGNHSKSNKENRTDRRSSLKNNVTTSIDLSEDNDSEHSSGGSLSKEVVKTLKQKGVSINYVNKADDKDVIHLP